MCVKSITVSGTRVSCVAVILLLQSLGPVSENKTEFEWQVSSYLLVRANIIIIGIAVVSIIDEIQKFISNSPRLQTKKLIQRSFATFCFKVESYCEICGLQHFENIKYTFKELKGNHIRSKVISIRTGLVVRLNIPWAKLKFYRQTSYRRLYNFQIKGSSKQQQRFRKIKRKKDFSVKLFGESSEIVRD